MLRLNKDYRKIVFFYHILLTYNKEKTIHAIISKGGFMSPIEFGKFLATLRNEKELTQEELAEKLFIDKRKVSRWECGMSIPDFETIVKLCEILDVTPYEFSICQKLEKEKLSKKIINKFKSLKSFKRYKLKKKILIILAIIIGIFFVFTAIYTILYYGKVEIYEFKSFDKKYFLHGTYTQTNNYTSYIINNIGFEHNIKSTNSFTKCTGEIYYNDMRLLAFKPNNFITNDENMSNLNLFYYGNLSITKYVDNVLTLQITCSQNNTELEKYLIPFKLFKKYDNKLF